MIRDYVIVGQGLAGSALAWGLQQRGADFVVVDEERPRTSSRVAAGLVTPITGQRLSPMWRWDEFWPTAVEFYRRIEKVLGAALFEERRMVRLFADDAERDVFIGRLESPEFRARVAQPQPLLDEREFNFPCGGFEMPFAGRLDVQRYLVETRRFLKNEGRLIEAAVDPTTNVALRDGHVCIDSAGLASRRLVFCQGLAGRDNPWFPNIPFRPAKGDILTLHIPDLAEVRIIHRGVWLAPVGGGFFRAGATYDWANLDDECTPEAVQYICSRLSRHLRIPFSVVDHVAAVRPTLKDYLPVVGIHGESKSVAVLNGLGSKGSLQSPWLANHLIHALETGGPLDPAIDLARRTRARAPRN